MPLLQRVNGWKLFPSLAVRFPVLLQKSMMRRSPIPGRAMGGLAFDVLRGCDGAADAFGARCGDVAGIRQLGEYRD